jgi:hypothetical protein
MPAFAAASRPPRTTNNDDSCDIALQPAATLLLPYFEVDFKSPSTTATTTLFNIQNVSPYPQLMFSKGKGSGSGIACTAQVGEVHAHAIGYVTIDVVATCSAKNPSSADYFAGTALFDNVLVGDYQQYVPRGENKTYFQGGSLVHIRTVPEGGPAGTMASTSLPYTFYDRYTAALPQGTADRRQPLPSAFAAR